MGHNYPLAINFIILLITLAGCVAPTPFAGLPTDQAESTPEGSNDEATVIPMPQGAPTAAATAPSDFDFWVHVIDAENDPIAAAKVAIEIQGEAPIVNYVDSNGYGRVVVPAAHAEQPGNLIVEAIGYLPRKEEIRLSIDQLPKEVHLEAQAATAVTSERLPNDDADTLFVMTEDDRFSTWIIGGQPVRDFQIGDLLIVYREIIPGVEVAIAQLRVVAQNPNSLLAQTVLINPQYKVQSGLRVDGNLDMLAASELVPSERFAVGYLLESGQIRLRPESGVEADMVLQAYEPQMIGERISDYLPFSPPILMRVTQIGVSGVVASVELLQNGQWPDAGTLVSDQGIVPTATATAVPPTPLPTTTPEPLPTPTPPPAPCPIGVDAELAVYWVRVEMGCPLSGSTITWASYTPYQTGLMLWRRDTNTVYGFFNNGTWLSVPDLWDGASSTPSRGTPPPSFKEPVRGTGHVWGTDDRFFNALGWAADDQKGFCAKVQTFEQGFILHSSTVDSCHEQNLFNFAAQGNFGLSFLKAHNTGYWRQ